MPILMPARVSAAAANAVAYVARFWAWWRGELLLCVPRTVAAILESEEHAIVIRPEAGRLVISGPDAMDMAVALDEEGTGVASWLVDRRQRADTAVLLLPANMVIRRVIDLPAAAATDLSSALPFLVERYTPFLHSCARYTYRIVAHKSKTTISIELAVTSKSQLEQIEARLHALAVTPNSIRIADAPAQTSFEFKPRHAVQSWRAEPSRMLTLGAVAILLAGPVVTEAIIDRVVAKRAAAAAAIHNQAAEIYYVQDRAKSAWQTVKFFHDKAARPASIEILRSVTAALADDCWVFSFDLDTKSLKLAGYAHDVPGVLRRLQALPWAHAIDFQAPVVHDSSGRGDRFELLIQVANSTNAIVSVQ